LPGVPIAAASPKRRMVLLEKNTRRASFLELVVDRLGLTNLSVVLGRVEETTLEADVCLARAFASPERTWQEAQRLLNPRGRVIYYAGRSWNSHTLDTLHRSGAFASVCNEAEHRWQGPIVSIASHPG
jgi:16S rRNA (guanine527-N7)-methyltransferase